MKRNLAAELEILDLQVVFIALRAVFHFELVERQLYGAHRRTRPAHVVVALDRARIVSVAVTGRCDVEALLVEKLRQAVDVVRAGQLGDQILVVVVEILLIGRGWQMLEVVRVAVAVCDAGRAIQAQNIEILRAAGRLVERRDLLDDQLEAQVIVALVRAESDVDDV